MTHVLNAIAKNYLLAKKFGCKMAQDAAMKQLAAYRKMLAEMISEQDKLTS